MASVWVRAAFCVFVSICFVPVAPVHAFDLPGIASDAERYEQGLRSRAPAQTDPAQRRAAVARALSASVASDWIATVAAWETAIGQGEDSVAAWLSLSDAQTKRQPPQPALALIAAWRAFSAAEAGAPEIPALLRMVDLLAGPLNQPLSAIDATEAAIERAPADASLVQRLADLQRGVGLLVRKIEAEAELDPPRACIVMTAPVAARRQPGLADFVSVEPRPSELAVSGSGARLCLENLAHGTRYRVALREGLPGATEGVRVRATIQVDVAIGNRAPRVAWDSRGHVLPRGQGERLSLTTINLSEVAIRVWRVGERSLVRQLSGGRTGSSLSPYEAASIAFDRGRLVHEGRLAVPAWQPNRPSRTAFDLSDAILRTGPGLFLLQAVPSDGTPFQLWEEAATQWLVVTDLGLTVLRGSDGLTVLARSYETAGVLPDVTLSLLARNNEVLGSIRTDGLGVGRFPLPLLRGLGGMEPVAVTASTQDGADFAWLDLTAAAFDLTDRGAGGQPHPGPIDAFAWLDRGIYRPGETVHFQALLRDDGGRPLDLPVTLRLRRPNGAVLSETVLPTEAQGFRASAIELSPTAPFGTWRAELLLDREALPVGAAEFRVEAFVPERLAVSIQPPATAFLPGQVQTLNVSARFLYGPPAVGLPVEAELTVERDPAAFPQHPGFRWGLIQDTAMPDRRTLTAPVTDGLGNSTVPMLVATLPDSTQPLRGTLSVAVSEPGGRPSRDRVSFPIGNPDGHVGIRPRFPGDAVDVGGEAVFDVISVGPTGEPRSGGLASVTVTREVPNWRLVVRGGLARYETLWRDDPVFTGRIEISASQPARLVQSLPPGRYRVEVAEANGRAAGSVRFRVGWTGGGDDTGVPDRLDLVADRAAYAPGDTATLVLDAPFAGTATIAIVTGAVRSLTVREVAAGRNEFTVAVDAAWGPGAHAAVVLHRPRNSTTGREPVRVLGLAWLGLDPKLRRLEVAIETPSVARPRTQVTIPVRITGATPETRVWLAAVDEGILRLTGFASPDPAMHFAGRRRLGVDILDDYGRLIGPAEGSQGVLRQGGDELADLLGSALPIVPFRILAIAQSPVAPGIDGVAHVPIDLPDFQGEVRLMAVAWDNEKTGSAQAALPVRDPLVAEPSLPRFLAPFDEARVILSLNNVELPTGPVQVSADASGSIEILGERNFAGVLGAGERSSFNLVLRGTGQGVGRLAITVSGPAGFSATRRFTLSVQPARTATISLTRRELPPGDTARVDTTGWDSWIAGTAKVAVSAGLGLPFDPVALIRGLEAFRYSCLEQLVSRAFPLVFLADEAVVLGGPPLPGDGRAERVQQATRSIFDKQRHDGGFGLWSAQDEAEGWAGSYAIEFLLRARAAGFTPPEAPLRQALRFVEQSVEGDPGSRPEDLAVRAYQLFVLALADQPRPGAMRLLAERGWDRLPTPLARAQLAAGFARIGDLARARAGFEASLRNLDRAAWASDYGSAERDAAAILVLLQESGILRERRTALVDRLRPEALRPNVSSTQEQAWALAASSFLSEGAGRVSVLVDGRPAPLGNPVTLNRRAEELARPVQIRNAGASSIWISETVTLVPRQPPAASREGMRIRRQFLQRDGSPVALDQIQQNNVFFLLLEGAAETGLDHRAIVVHPLPAGWEIEPVRLGPGTPEAFAFLGELSTVAGSAAGDDRFAAAVDLTAQQREFRVAFAVRAVTAGSFELPGASIEDMYRPRFQARQATGRIVVHPEP